MRKFCFCILLLISGCRSRQTLNIYIENGSASQKNIPIELYLDGKLFKNIQVKRGNEVIVNKHVKVIIPTDKPSTILFKVTNSNYQTQCVVNPENLTSKTWMHVALGETVFKKGYEYLGRTLDKDTMMESKFYCELVDQPICGSIEE